MKKEKDDFMTLNKRRESELIVLQKKQSASQSLFMQTHDSYIHLQHEKVLEERNLLNLQG